MIGFEDQKGSKPMKIGLEALRMVCGIGDNVALMIPLLFFCFCKVLM